MEKHRIERYIKSKGVPEKQRVDVPNGGQYLSNFLVEFSQFVIEDLLNDQIGVLRKLKDPEIRKHLKQ